MLRPGRGFGPPPAWVPQRGLQAHVHAHQPDLVTHLGEIQIGRPDHLDLVGIHQLVVEDVPRQQYFALTTLKLTQVKPGGAQRDRTPVHVIDGQGIQVSAPPPDAHHHPGHRRVVVAATMHPGDQVDEAAHLLARLVQHRGVVQAHERDDVMPHLPGRHQALRIGLEQGRGAAVAVTVPRSGLTGPREKAPVGHSNLLDRRPIRVATREGPAGVGMGTSSIWRPGRW